LANGATGNIGLFVLLAVPSALWVCECVDRAKTSELSAIPMPNVSTGLGTLRIFLSLVDGGPGAVGRVPIYRKHVKQPHSGVDQFIHSRGDEDPFRGIAR
jgi:hypothetical protein